MRISEKGIALIKRFEGLSLKPYLCPAGIPTIGYGTTVYPDGTQVKVRDARITEQQAERILMSTIEKYEAALNRYSTQPFNQNHFDALVSFAYNVGIGNLQRSTLLRQHNAGLYIEAENEFGKWVHADGKRLKGLVARRRAEADLYAGRA